MSGKDDEGPMKGRPARRLIPLLISVLSSLAILAGYACASTGAPPSIEGESATNITPTSATLNADINLHEAPAGVYYQFQVVNDPSEYAPEIVCPPEPTSGPFRPCIGAHSPDALPIGFLPGNTLQPGATLGASLDLTSAGVTLHPGTTYHYRVLVARAVQTEDTIEWEPPTIVGADQTFTTLPSPPPATNPDPQGGGVSQSAVLSPSLSQPRRHHHRRHRKHARRVLHRSKVSQARLAG
jgi:hypothetical protein